MGDLARRRAALDLRVSRGHLQATAVGVVLISGLSFGLGVLVGRDVPASAEMSPAGRSGVADDAVVELLARVDAMATIDAASDLTFPDALRTGEAPAVAVVAPSDAAEMRLEAPVGVVPRGVDAAPEQPWTVELTWTPDASEARALRDQLRQAGFDAWLGAALVDGTLEYRLAVGGHSSKAKAEAAREQLLGALDTDALGGVPQVRRVGPEVQSTRTSGGR